MRKTKISLLLLLVLFSLGLVPSDNDLYMKITRSIDIFGKIYKEVSLKYVDRVDPEEFMASGIKGLLSSLDPYTVYIDQGMQQDIEVITTGKYGGIGASIGLRNNQITVVELIEGYSAQRQGVRVGDIIYKIDSTLVNKDTYDELSKLLKGDPGSLVRVEVEREGYEENVVFNLVREEIKLKNLTWYGFYPVESNNAYLKLSGFSRSAGGEVKKALLDLKKQKEVKSVVLDLRGNPGGLLDAAIDVCEKFVGRDQLVVSVMGRDTTDVTEYYSKEQPVAGEAKLVVLVDKGSASASEIVAGAVQDLDRGIIVGQNSFGKGLVQTVVPLSYNTSLKITTAKYFTPSGRSIQRIDYAKKNKVFESVNVPVNKSEFKTVNQRSVYSGGGIEPDTVVENTSKSKQVKNLLAQGMFFRFATTYFNENENTNWDEVADSEIFDSFIKFLHNEEYRYTSKTELTIKRLKKVVDSESYAEDLNPQIDELLNACEELKDKELVKYKFDILREIKKEIASRRFGREGRIMASLENDNQFWTALEILKDKAEYNVMLSIAN